MSQLFGFYKKFIATDLDRNCQCSSALYCKIT